MSFTIAGHKVGPVGIGMIPFLNPSGNVTFEDSIKILKAALDQGANFWDTGEHYGTPERNSLHLTKAYFEKYPEDADKVFLSVKGAYDFATRAPTNDRAGVHKSIENCLQILDGSKKIDLFETSRGDRNVPVEETVNAIGEYVKAGKIGSVGLSECSAETIKKASAVQKIAAVELELSLFSTDILTSGVAEACKEHGIPIVAYSPLGRGFLTGSLRKPEDIPEGDFRRMFPRFQGENFYSNFKLVEEVEAVAKRKGCTTARVAIGWVSAQSKQLGVPVVPIPGTANAQRLKENLTSVELTKEELDEINGVLEKIEVKGNRYPGAFNDQLSI